MQDIRVIRILSLAIMAAAAATSYTTQRGIFLSWQVDEFTASVAPISVDLLAIICTLALHHPQLGKVVPTIVLILTVSGSVTANWLAGETIGAKAVHAGMVGLYLLAEWVASQRTKPIKADATVVGQAQAVVQETETEVTADEAASSELPAAPVSPPYGPRGAYGPRNPEKGYSPRQKQRIAKAKAGE